MPEIRVGVKAYAVFWSVPQTTLPDESVWRLPEQEMRVAILSPPPTSERPLTVEVAVVALSEVVWMPPANVEVAVEVEVIEPVVSLPIEEEARKESVARKSEANSEVVVALVVVEFAKV